MRRYILLPLIVSGFFFSCGDFPSRIPGNNILNDKVDSVDDNIGPILQAISEADRGKSLLQINLKDYLPKDFDISDKIPIQNLVENLTEDFYEKVKEPIVEALREAKCILTNNPQFTNDIMKSSFFHTDVHNILMVNDINSLEKAQIVQMFISLRRFFLAYVLIKQTEELQNYKADSEKEIERLTRLNKELKIRNKSLNDELFLLRDIVQAN